MKILLIAEGRCGSHSLGEWLSEELRIPFIREYEENTYKDNFIIKRGLKEINLNETYDFYIRLYRENTVKQSESAIHAILSDSYHIEDINKQYEIDEKFLRENHELIWQSKLNSDIDNKELKQLDLGLLVSYEQIFVDEIGEKLITDYIGFTPKISIINPNRKFRKENYKLDNFTLQLSIDLLTNEITILKERIDGMLNETEKMFELVDKLTISNEENREYRKIIENQKRMIEKLIFKNKKLINKII